MIIIPLPTQSSSWPATVQVGIEGGTCLEDTSWFPVSSSTTHRSTSRLTPKKCQLSGATSCTGETSPRHPCSSSPGLTMSGELTTKMEPIGSKRQWLLIPTSHHPVAGWSLTLIQKSGCRTARWPAASPPPLRRAASPCPCPGKPRNCTDNWRAPTQILGWSAWGGR